MEKEKDLKENHEPVVCVSTSTIPVTWNGLWIKGKYHSSNLSDPLSTSKPFRFNVAFFQ